MSFSFLNPWLLFGLLGIGVPILIHLLSRKSAHVVEWGAMQFLELGKRTKRRYRMEHLLLLLLRMILVILLVLALARPWGTGLALWEGSQRSARDVVIILDCSFSMDQRTQPVTPFNQARLWINNFLKQHQPGDHYFIYSAHDLPHPLLPEWVSQPEKISEQLPQLKSASGSSNLPEAILAGLQKLNTAPQPNRELIVLTDQHAASWQLENELLWERIKLHQQQVPQPPRIWKVNLLDEATSNKTPFPNAALAPLQLSKQTTLQGAPVRIQTTATLWEATEPVTRRVIFKINGQPLQEQAKEVTLTPGKPLPLDFEYQFSEPGTHLISVEWESDLYPGDDLVSAVVSVQDRLELLLVEGTPNIDPTLQETYFLKTALSPSTDTEQSASMIHTTLIESRFLQEQELDKYNLVCLANVAELTKPATEQIRHYVEQGGALLILLGDLVDPEAYHRTLFSPDIGVVQAELNHQQTDRSPQFGGIHIDNPSLNEPWLKQFQTEAGGGLTSARFDRWWVGKWQSDQQSPTDNYLPAWPQVNIQLETGDPWMLTAPWGLGQVTILTSPLDTAWSNLPSKPDYVPFIYELILNLTQAQSSYNIHSGEPLLISSNLLPGSKQATLTSPDGSQHTLALSKDAFQFTDTWASGIYQVEATQTTENQSRPNGPIYYAVTFKADESNPLTLNDSQTIFLKEMTEYVEVESLPQLLRDLRANNQKTEFTTLLLLMFVLLLIGESLMTRRLVQGGHLLQQEPIPSPKFTSDNPAEEQTA